MGKAELKPVTVLLEPKYIQLLDIAAELSDQKRSAYLRLLVMKDLRAKGLIPELDDIIIAGGSSNEGR